MNCEMSPAEGEKFVTLCYSEKYKKLHMLSTLKCKSNVICGTKILTLATLNGHVGHRFSLLPEDKQGEYCHSLFVSSQTTNCMKNINPAKLRS